MRSLIHDKRRVVEDGICIRVRVRRSKYTTNLDIGESHDMVCTLVNWESPHGGTGVGGRKKPQHPRGPSYHRPSLVDKFRSSTISKVDPIPANGKVTPLLVFQTRTVTGPTLEACCTLQSVNSCDSMDPSIVSESIMDKSIIDQEPLAFTSYNNNNDNDTNLQREALDSNNNSDATPPRPPKKTYTVPCNSIKTVEKVNKLFHGYRLFFVTGSRGSYELEFENKNGMDVMVAFLQATIPPERLVNLTTPSMDAAEESVSHMSTLDVEKLTERLAEEQQGTETMSERIRKRVGRFLSSIEEMSSSICDTVCCSAPLMIGATVAPDIVANEIRDCPPKSSSVFENKDNSNNNNKAEEYTQLFMEIDEEQSVAASETFDLATTRSRIRYLRDNNRLPSVPSME